MHPTRRNKEGLLERRIPWIMSRIRTTQETIARIPIIKGMRTVWWYARKWRHITIYSKSQKIEPDNLKNPAKNRLSSESEGARHGTGPMGEKISAPALEEWMSKEHKEAAKTELGKEHLEA
ncbi:hypothetical protein V1478_000241 [Vespula squamosa]|uniref:Uncharacterized protein n=1 Tax=Vespula squamosa TaxID=30214 RepID=A0ABD2C4Y4_VESSQ